MGLTMSSISMSRYHRLGKEERRILQLLRDKDPEDDHHVVHMKDFLVFRKHICISFELLGSDMHAMQTKKGESVSYVRKCAYPILKCLQLLKRENIMHSDLKLANMVMSGKDPNTLKVIDFGLSLVQDEPRYYSRIQTQSIRAPEVTLGLLCTTAIDMWSFGCCLIELLIGREAFYGDEEYEQLTRTIEILGMPPEELVASSSQRNVFFDEQGTLKYIRVNNSGEIILPGSKRLESLLGTSDPDLLDFIKRCLDWDSSKRMTPGQALEHAWMMKTSLGCMSPTPGNPPKTVMLKTLAAGTTQHLKPDEATGSQPQTMDQGEMDKLGKHGRTLRPLTSELDPLLPPIGATAPASPPRGKRVTVTPDGGADRRDAGATKPAGQAGCSRVSPIGAAAPSPPPRDEEGMLKYIRLNISGKKILPGSDTLENLLGIRVPDLLDFMQPRLHLDSSKRMTPGPTLEPAWMKKTFMQSPGRPPKAVMLKTLAEKNTQHLKPDEATGSQPHTMDQGRWTNMGKLGRTLRPLTSELDPLLPCFGATGPAPPPRGKRLTAITDGGAAKSVRVTSKPARQARFSLLPPFRATAPVPSPSCKRATVTTHGLAARCIGSQMHLKPNKATGSQPQTTDQGLTAKLRIHGRTMRPLTLETYSKVLPIGVASPAPPSRGKREIADEGTFRTADRRYSPLSHPLVELHQLLPKKPRGQLVP